MLVNKYVNIEKALLGSRRKWLAMAAATMAQRILKPASARRKLKAAVGYHHAKRRNENMNVLAAKTDSVSPRSRPRNRRLTKPPEVKCGGENY